MPEPPPDLLDRTKQAWATFWSSPLAEFMQPTDLAAIDRLFAMYDELERTRHAIVSDPPVKPIQGINEGHNDYQIRLGEWRTSVAAQGRLVKDGRGGHRLNPLLIHMRTLEVNIRGLEDRFGLSLRARQELGLNQLRAATLSEQNRLQDMGYAEVVEDDPRASLHVAGSDD